MKAKLTSALSLLLPILAHAESGAWQKDFDALLQKYVSNGGVRYAAWKSNGADVAALNKVVAAIATDGPSGGRYDKLAFYINAYNAWIIHEVLEKYPIKSVKDLAPLYGVFTGKRIELGGEKMSLNHLEKDLILKGIGEPRAHFAVNCASRSCPVLIPAAYNGATLDATLNERARAYVTSPLGVQFQRMESPRNSPRSLSGMRMTSKPPVGRCRSSTSSVHNHCPQT